MHTPTAFLPSTATAVPQKNPPIKNTVAINRDFITPSFFVGTPVTKSTESLGEGGHRLSEDWYMRDEKPTCATQD